MHPLILSSLWECVLRLWGEQNVFLPSFQRQIQNYQHHDKLKFLAPVNLNYSALTAQN